MTGRWRTVGGRPGRRLFAAIALWGLGLFSGCAATGIEEFSSLAAKPSLPCSVLVTGGSFVQAPPGEPEPGGAGARARTFALAPEGTEAFPLDDLMRSLDLGKVFVAMTRDHAPVESRRRVAGIRADTASDDEALEATLLRARTAGHDFLLVVERIEDGPVEARGVNDRWPFTLGAWLFALGAFIPDRTYESRARLQVSMRDVYSGRRVFAPILLEAGPVDLNMIERCTWWGFVQSIIVPPFWTSTDDASIVGAVRVESVGRLLIAAVRRLKSAEVRAQLGNSGPAAIEVERTEDGHRVRIDSSEALRAVALRRDGAALAPEVEAAFAQACLRSVESAGERYRYTTSLPPLGPGRLLQVIVQTEAAGLSSTTVDLPVP